MPAPRDTRLPALQSNRLPIPWRGVATVAAGVGLALLQRQLVAYLGRGAMSLATRQGSGLGRRILGQTQQPSRTVIDSLVILWRRNAD